MCAINTVLPCKRKCFRKKHWPMDKTSKPMEIAPFKPLFGSCWKQVLHRGWYFARDITVSLDFHSHDAKLLSAFSFQPFPALGALISSWTPTQHTPWGQIQIDFSPMLSVWNGGTTCVFSMWNEAYHTQIKDTYTPHWVCRRRLDLVRPSLDPYTWELRLEGCQCNCHGRCHASGEHCRNRSRSKKNMAHLIKATENETLIETCKNPRSQTKQIYRFFLYCSNDNLLKIMVMKKHS